MLAKMKQEEITDNILARMKQEEDTHDFEKGVFDNTKFYDYEFHDPQPTIVLPPNYPFRTTATGYPIFRRRTQMPRRASMTTAQGFEDPRITAFIDHWTKIYEGIGHDPFSRAEGYFQLQLACEVRGLVTYGTMDKLVVRLVDRALRDAARGWMEITDKVGRVRMLEAPAAPAVVAESESESELWWPGLSYDD
ncbi:uncharacterized protein N0V89_012606 [Didymosphaeria variabile]|uniref:Uncharacterized protein n=1 Tax=Didymosphaeria variabile TaxID=1932322 RepID=A0A9W9C575_9PLEO|nr:uncharacterized protein N0V89_012606 [Didymosphaeria variabile]KAJ4344862.1 hypothetical protein N0V89_012606 [Didymosphaeria variabile]